MQTSCDGKIVSTLEKYDLEALASSTAAHVRALWLPVITKSTRDSLCPKRRAPIVGFWPEGALRDKRVTRYNPPKLTASASATQLEEIVGRLRSAAELWMTPLMPTHVALS